MALGPSCQLWDGQTAEVLQLATRGAPSTAVHYQASPWGSHARSVWEEGGGPACQGSGESKQPFSF